MRHIIREWRIKVYHVSQEETFWTSDEWLELRRAVFKRDKQICKRCDETFRLSSLNAHHMMPRAKGGADHISNLVTLCEPCHDFVEIQGLHTVAAIIGSFDTTPDDAPIIPTDDDDEFKRPLWHKWVYGGQKHLRKP